MTLGGDGLRKTHRRKKSESEKERERKGERENITQPSLEKLK